MASAQEGRTDPPPPTPGSTGGNRPTAAELSWGAFVLLGRRLRSAAREATPVLEGVGLGVALVAAGALSLLLWAVGTVAVLLYAGGRDLAGTVGRAAPRAGRGLRRGARARSHALVAAWRERGDLGPVVVEDGPPIRQVFAPRRARRVLAAAGAVALLWQATDAGLASRVPLSLMAVAVGVHGDDATLPPLHQRSVLLAADGTPLVTVHAADANRAPVSLRSVAPALVHAVVDTEDARFWDHGGVDLKGIVRAATHNLARHDVREGGSTITQQLVKTTLLSPERKLSRKLKEIVLADRLERRIGKRAVLERYLNTVYFGEGAYGVEAAAQAYFAKPASAVDPAEAALLAGLIQGPGDYDPVRHPAAAKARRHHVLGRMVDHGDLSSAEAAKADAAPLPTDVHRPRTERGYETSAVISELLADSRLGSTVAERRRRLFSGGLRVHTTIDARAQLLATAAVRDGVPRGDGLSAAVATVDPATGGVRAIVGGLDFTRSQYDATQGRGRQTGSAFKVFTLVTALEQGKSPADRVDGSSPCPIPNPGGTPNPWKPDNYEGEAFGKITLTSATVHSVNCAYARLADDVGIEDVARTAKRMGVTAPIAPVPSLTLGTNPVPPVQMASAYATLAADGVYHRPHLVDHVEDASGRRLLANRPAGERVVPSSVAREATAILEKVVDDGTGKEADVPGRAVAGKTGTADDSRDAWFVGYTPELATAVWMGHPDAERPIVVGGKPVVGGSYPAKIWRAFMGSALSGVEAERFPRAPTRPPDDDRTVTGDAGTPDSGTKAGSTWCWTSCGHTGPPPPAHP